MCLDYRRNETGMRRPRFFPGLGGDLQLIESYCESSCLTQQAKLCEGALAAKLVSWIGTLTGRDRCSGDKSKEQNKKC